MTESDIIDLVAQALSCDASELNGSSGLGRHARWDSLGHVTIFAALEEKYKIPVNEATIGSLTTIEKIVEHLERRV